MVLGHIAGNTVAVHIYFSVPVIPDVLRREVHFDIGSVHVVIAVPAEIIGISPGILLQIDRLSHHMASGFDILADLFDLVFHK